MVPMKPLCLPFRVSLGRITLRAKLSTLSTVGCYSVIPKKPVSLPLQRVSTYTSKSSGASEANNTPLAILVGIATTVAVGSVIISRNRKEKSREIFTIESNTGVDLFAEASADYSKLPKETAVFTTAPHVPPSITRDYPVLLQVPLTTSTKTTQLSNQYKYEQWTFNGNVPGPFIRARVGDVVELTLTNHDVTGNPHNIDCHAFTGPGGGAALTTAEEKESKTGLFKLLHPGLYVYHCAAAPVPVHIANGMYGLIYVQPEDGDLPPVDREYYVMQSEFYHEPPGMLENGKRSSTVEFSYPNALEENPSLVVFNGSESALTRDQPLKAKSGETVRIFFGNAGPNLTSAFHVIGTTFSKLYRDGDVVSPPASWVPTTSVPPGGSTIVDLKLVVPGTYTLVDHAIFRLDKGAVGYLNVSGKQRPDVYQSTLPPAPCVGCKLHP
ncbi:nitrite reductase, copper-containing [Trichophyton rubrum D6]|uniref:Copper-containing nitrite reductase n=2 Tax=Trichophyton rubrum TaxID=5551 RepID=F2SUL0_TRIRC|nr:nitrite reductase, copper-containing [Trichophyton rubrum CBS 118892]EZF25265.1 nitrite reductase, copper-containing [Trichophyton rubrum MR850]EZF44260.1 nitrite reductase, copper-containing [Trichophyton rubrum CBS 100081]EZF54950.1 nitrite reductase, copper-containing [Trichophyton rubrum CBS 288.86]EZF65568.1 nitrite reductase, copper-containing [Trichophyton rubrum CBS 289.86]EZF86861.1 nitrite reductase, copper-containing [Trichophyton rubrum MR1448]EZF97651.1 nitrite reductase, copp